MDNHEYFDNKRKIEEILILYLQESTEDDSINLKKILAYVDEQNIRDDENEFRLLLYLIDSVTMNHCRNPMYYIKVKNILLNFKEEFKKYFTELEILKFFIFNKLILLILLESDIIAIDEMLAIHLIEKCSVSTHGFFYPELKKYLNEQQIKKIEDEFKVDMNDEEVFNNFNGKRRLGENDSYICKLIRDDSVIEFTKYVNQTNFPISSNIMPSMFETNQYLITNKPTILEYAAFYGSIQIFQYLKFNNVELTPSLWLYAIHSNNPELIHLLEECEVKPKNENYKDCLIESLYCHHHDFINYINENYYNVDDDIFVTYSIMTYNFNFIPNIVDVGLFYYFCMYDYFNIVKKMLNEKQCPINFGKYLKYDNTIKTASTLSHCIDNDKLNIVKLLLGLKTIDFDFDSLTTRSLEENKMNSYYSAANNNNFKMIQLLFKYRKPDINCKNVIKLYSDKSNFFEIREISPLMQAIRLKNIDIIKKFLSDPAFNINFGDRRSLYSDGDISWNTSNHVYYFKTLLHEAVERGYFEIVKLLLENPNIQINEKMVDELNKIDETALCIAIKKGNLRIVELLLANPKIMINKKSAYKINDIEYHETPLHLSIREKKFDIAKLLLNRSDIDVNAKTIYSIISPTDSKMKEMIVESALHLAVRNKYIEIIKLLVNHPQINVNKAYSKYFYEKNNSNKASHEKNTALNMAIINGDNEIISILLSNQSIDYNYKGINYIDDMKFAWNALTISIYYHRNDIVKKLLALDNININSEIMISKPFSYTEMQSALYLAISKGNNDITQSLLKRHEINVNYVSIYISANKGEIKEKVLLHLAFEKGDLMIINSLLLNPNINLTIDSYYRNSDKTYFKEYRETTFICAIKYGNTEIVKHLLSDPRFNCVLQSTNIDIKQDQVNISINEMYENALLGTNVDIFILLLDYAYKHKFHVINVDYLMKITENVEMKVALEQFLEQNNISIDDEELVH